MDFLKALLPKSVTRSSKGEEKLKVMLFVEAYMAIFLLFLSQEWQIMKNFYFRSFTGIPFRYNL
jgi:hypothetical protein